MPVSVPGLPKRVRKRAQWRKAREKACALIVRLKVSISVVSLPATLHHPPLFQAIFYPTAAVHTAEGDKAGWCGGEAGWGLVA